MARHFTPPPLLMAWPSIKRRVFFLFAASLTTILSQSWSPFGFCRLVQELASEKAVCDYALYVGASVDNFASIPKLAGEAAALKMYLNDTYTTLK